MLGVFNVPHSGIRDLRHQTPEFVLAVRQSLCPDVLAISHQQIECKEARMELVGEQIIEAWSATFVQAHNLTVETVWPRYGEVIDWRSSGNELKACPLREMSSARPFCTTTNERNPSYFSSKIRSGWSKGGGLMRQRHRLEWACGKLIARDGERWAKTECPTLS
jgi:hypothetical protein